MHACHIYGRFTIYHSFEMYNNVDTCVFTHLRHTCRHDETLTGRMKLFHVLLTGQLSVAALDSAKNGVRQVIEEHCC